MARSKGGAKPTDSGTRGNVRAGVQGPNTQIQDTKTKGALGAQKGRVGGKGIMAPGAGAGLGGKPTAGGKGNYAGSQGGPKKPPAGMKGGK
jgi:hypothetical protein